MPDRGRAPGRHRPLTGLALLIAVALVAALLWARWLAIPLAVLLVVYAGLIAFDRARSRHDPR